jgi:hypothetical protein
MNKGKSKLTTFVLLTVIIILIFSIFYISVVISQDSIDQSVVPTVPRKTKAADVTYRKTIALNATAEEYEESSEELAEEEEMVSPSPEVGISPSVSPITAPSPTEIILAYQSTSPIASESFVPTGSSGTTSLPESGFINNAIIMFAASGLLIFFAFLF